MSHFTIIKTGFKHLSYLENTLKKLNITYFRKKTLDIDLENLNMQTNNKNLLIFLPNSSDDIACIWNGENYDLMYDNVRVQQEQRTVNFISEVKKQYKNELITQTISRLGFEERQNNYKLLLLTK